MAADDLLVTISGAALSLLFYENVRSPGDQMGFLLGETLEFVVKTYTDSDNQVETVKIHVNIETVMTCPLPEVLHDATGRINKEKLKDFVRDKGKQVVGWFRFRRNTCLVPTLRDKLLHKQLASHFASGNGSKEELFAACLLSASTSRTKGTHKFRHVFLRQKRGMFEPIPLRINNLGDDAFRHDGSDYKPAPSTKPSSEPDVFAKMIDSLNLDLTRTSGVESAIAIQKAAEQYLNTLIPRVCDSDREVAELEKQVRELKTKISSRASLRKIKVNGNSDVVSQNYEVEKSSENEEARIPEKSNQSPPRIDSPEKIECRSYKSHPTPSQTISVHKATRNTAACIARSVSQESTRRMGLGTDTTLHSPNQEPLLNIVSEVKLDVNDAVSSRTRRSTSGVSEIARESVCKGEPNEIGVGRGRGKTTYEFSPMMKKPKRTSTSISAARCAAEKSSIASEQNTSEANCVQNSSVSQISYSQAARKNLENTCSVSVSPDNH